MMCFKPRNPVCERMGIPAVGLGKDRHIKMDWLSPCPVQKFSVLRKHHGNPREGH